MTFVIPSGLSIASGTVSAIDLTAANADATTTVLDSTTLTIVGSEARAFVKAGTNLHRYKITMVLLLTPGVPTPTIEEDFIMIVQTY